MHRLKLSPELCCSLALVLLSCRVTMLRSPPTSILTLLPASWAPTRLVLAPLLTVRLLVALMRVLSGGPRTVGVGVALACAQLEADAGLLADADGDPGADVVRFAAF